MIIMSIENIRAANGKIRALKTTEKDNYSKFSNFGGNIQILNSTITNELFHLEPSNDIGI